jgi:hypothetical protein
MSPSPGRMHNTGTAFYLTASCNADTAHPRIALAMLATWQSSSVAASPAGDAPQQHPKPGTTSPVSLPAPYCKVGIPAALSTSCFSLSQPMLPQLHTRRFRLASLPMCPPRFASFAGQHLAFAYPTRVTPPRARPCRLASHVSPCPPPASSCLHHHTQQHRHEPHMTGSLIAYCVRYLCVCSKHATTC